MLSIIIPVLNEAETIESLLLHLSENSSGANDLEVILVDGGSIDNTAEIVENFIETFSRPVRFQKSDRSFTIQVIPSNKGRAIQMNTGASLASGEILYFLHADSFPPKNFDSYIISEVNKGNLAGCFQIKFDSNHWWLRLAGWLTKFKWKGCRGGDQSQFITKTLFREIDGFDENYIIYEDNILINTLYKKKQFVVIPHWVITSARRYETQGIWNLQYHFWIIHLKQFFGADAEELHRYYKKHIEGKKHK
ncbi:TIGR04283 family arsenosugar biosynthesis glycosyltransferase [Aequorivita marina]|uniref:TIGR04283 family arsenosugar biosynthesis glycosyltransferase n=1 Tax=Aequorivita marina TaxID=3073654 RepID=UPI002875B119|nr:TIGR04283 family arsenosugar biosynthesis glycosyltransferase [Aequorivita sp. S2608]MDS1298425.1 TIGR04283 family arsenosugar biosynthesis glycosyltransferase [Aequorivita sp. S2608]